MAYTARRAAGSRAGLILSVSFVSFITFTIFTLPAGASVEAAEKKPAVETSRTPDIALPLSRRPQIGAEAGTRTRAERPRAATSLIPNGSFEEVAGRKPLGWLQGGYGANARSYEYPVPGVRGSKAAKVTLAQRVDGDAKWYFAPLALSPGVYSYTEPASSLKRSAGTKVSVQPSRWQREQLHVMPVSIGPSTEKRTAWHWHEPWYVIRFRLVPAEAC